MFLRFLPPFTGGRFYGKGDNQQQGIIFIARFFGGVYDNPFADRTVGGTKNNGDSFIIGYRFGV